MPLAAALARLVTSDGALTSHSQARPVPRELVSLFFRLFRISCGRTMSRLRNEDCRGSTRRRPEPFFWQFR